MLAAASRCVVWLTAVRVRARARPRRPDFLKQMYRWAVQYAEPDREENPKRAAMQVEVIDISPTLSIGFTLAFLKYTDAGCVHLTCP